ncbi:TIGR00282 family metallophosphoesterase [Desulfovibrio oxyclinae]|uniref:TIGR00282 family metallophosphoesterase n=1 Tax=Desulfovibrio oxyclinae TaxID=63560 RepID=UPI00037FC5AB|nr:TIGR00282 family metallophosphoesterase [Desulfovibrio oxyclinae]
MKILMLGDIVGRPGRREVATRVQALRRELGVDLVIANGENASGGIGISAKSAKSLLNAGVDVLTSGNHVWKFRDLHSFMGRESRFVRPYNYPEGTPGKGLTVIRPEGLEPVAVLNLQGRTFMHPIDCPFKAADRALAELPEDVRIVVCDFHAEATGEKQALAWYLDGRVSVLVGTHTHVQTADARVLPGGSGYMTDLGFCGAWNSCLGMDPEPVVSRFVTGIPSRFVPAKGPVILQGAVFDIDDSTGRTCEVSLWRKETW